MENSNRNPQPQLLSGNEAIALAAYDAGIALGTGYPGTPSTEILEHFALLGGKAQWSPNEKCALEVAIGVSFGGARALCTMKHVGLNVAADPFFSCAYTGSDGGLVIVSADDPGMSSSQNEQDNRRYAHMAGVPVLEPSDSQEAYELTVLAFELSETFRSPIMLRLTTRVCHSKGVVLVERNQLSIKRGIFQRDISSRVMIPAHARRAHKRLRERIRAIQAWNESYSGNLLIQGGSGLGIITSGVSYVHAREAAPDASFFKLTCSYPLPIERLRQFCQSTDRCLVVEEGDPVLVESLRYAGLAVEDKPEMFRFGELNVGRVRRLIKGDLSPEPAPVPGKPPELCQGCPHRKTFETLRDLNCIVSGDIGCYTLGALPPFSAMDLQLCMGASIGMGAGLRQVLPEDQARRVVSVIGDSTFVHSGISGLVDTIYNAPSCGHTILILDNGTTAMTGLQEHPATGRTLAHLPASRLILENVVRSLGVERVFVIDPIIDPEALRIAINDSLASNSVTVIIVRRACILSASKIKKREVNECRDAS